MEILNQILPEAIVNNIRKYHSHPKADMIHNLLSDGYYEHECERYKRKTGRHLQLIHYITDTYWDFAKINNEDWNQIYLDLHNPSQRRQMTRNTGRAGLSLRLQMIINFL